MRALKSFFENIYFLVTVYLNVFYPISFKTNLTFCMFYKNFSAVTFKNCVALFDKKKYFSSPFSAKMEEKCEIRFCSRKKGKEKVEKV